MKKLIVCLLFLSLTACASPARVGKMASMPVNAQAQTSNTALTEAIKKVEVTGGSTTNPLWLPKVGNAEFQQALQQSLQAHHLYDALKGRYSVDVELVELGQPLAGFNLTVTAKTKLKLTEISTNKTVLQEEVLSNYKAAFGDSVLATERLRLANEGAIRENIAQIIEKLKQYKQ